MEVNSAILYTQWRHKCNFKVSLDTKTVLYIYIYIYIYKSLDTKTHVFILFLSGFSSSGVLDFQISRSNSVIEDPVYCWYSILLYPFLLMVLPYGRHNIKGQQHDHQEVIFRCY